MTFTNTNNTGLTKFLPIASKIILSSLFSIFIIYICLVGTVYGLRFLTWQPVVEIANISDESQQKFHNYEMWIINTFAFIPEERNIND